MQLITVPFAAEAKELLTPAVHDPVDPRSYPVDAAKHNYETPDPDVIHDEQFVAQPVVAAVRTNPLHPCE